MLFRSGAVRATTRGNSKSTRTRDPMLPQVSVASLAFGYDAKYPEGTGKDTPLNGNRERMGTGTPHLISRRGAVNDLYPTYMLERVGLL